MKRRFIIFFILIFILLVLYVNKYLELEYNVNILEYIQLSSDFTSEELEIINKYQPLVFGGNINEPPLGIYYEKNRQYVGFVVDYINALSIELGVPIVSQPMIWNEALEALKKGETDLCDMTPSDERAKSFAFSDSIYRLRGLIVVKNSNDRIHDLYDLDGMTVGVQKGDYSIEYITSKEINANFVYTDNVSGALNLLYNNKVNAVVGDEPVIRYYLNELHYADNYRILEKPFYDNVCAVAVSKEQKELLKVIDKAIFNMKRKGINRKIQMKWLGHTTFLSENKSVEKLKLNLVMALALAMIIGYLIYLWNRSLKLLVDFKTKQLQFMKNELEITFDGIENFLIVLGKDLKIKNINSSFLRYLEVKKKLILNSFFMDISLLCDFEQQNEKLIYRLLTCYDKCGKFDTQKKYEIKSRGRLFQVSIYPLERNKAEVINILVMISDITNTRIQEQKLIHSNKMETIGQLAAGMAHELRNPLGVIRNSTFILHDEYKEKDKLKTMAIEAIDNSVDRASKIIENLLKSSRLTDDKKEWTNLKNLIAEVMNLYRKPLSEKNILLDIFCEENIFIYINSESLEHILMNLIHNAIDAMEKEGELEIHCFCYLENIEIKVKDNGIGIEEEMIDRIFDPFYTTKSVGEGTGLGLYIAYSEAKKIEGDIKVISEKNKGTTFIIDIPCGSENIWEQN